MRSNFLLSIIVSAQTVCLLVLLVFVRPALAGWVEWIVDAGISYNHTENINNAFVEADERDDSIITSAFTFGRVYQLAVLTRATLSVELSYDYHDDIANLNHLSTGGVISIKHKFGIGRAMPWIQATAAASRLDYRGDLWDSNLYTLKLSSGKRLHDRVDATVIYTYEFRDGDTSPSTFDHNSQTGAVGLNFLLTEKALLGVKYSIRGGDIAAVCSPKSFARIQDIAKDVQFDDTFEKGWCLYRIDATTQTFGINLSYAFFGGHSSLNLGYEHQDGDITRFTYSTDTAWASINYSY